MQVAQEDTQGTGAVMQAGGQKRLRAFGDIAAQQRRREVGQADIASLKKRFELAQLNGTSRAGLGPQSSLVTQEREEAWHARHEGRRDAVPNPCKPRHDELEQLLDRHLGIGEHRATRRLTEAAWCLGAHPLVDERLYVRW